MRRFELFTVGLVVAALLLVLGPLGHMAQAQDVAILYVDDGSSNHVPTLAQQIQTAVTFDSLATIDVGAATPTLAALSAYDGLFVYNLGPFADASALGDVLYDYVNEGGGVVLAMQTHSLLDNPLHGAFESAGYHPFEPSWVVHNTTALGLGTIVDPSHPAIANVNSLSISPNPITSQIRYVSVIASDGSTTIARFNNSASTPLLAERKGIDGRVLALNFHGPSTATFGNGWVESTDGDVLIAEALHYVTLAGVPFAIRTNEELLAPRGDTATITDEHLYATDLLTNDDQVVYTITHLPDRGDLVRGSTTLGVNDTFTQQDLIDSLVSYVHDNSGSSDDQFAFSVSNGSESISAIFMINVLGPNQPPQLTLPAEQIVPGNNQSILFYPVDGNGIGVNDPDAGNGQMLLTLNIDRGMITILNPGSVSITGTHPGQSLELRGTLSQLQMALNAGVRVARPSGTFEGTVYLDVFVDDQGSTGTGGPLTDEGQILITYQAPFFSGSSSSCVARGGTATGAAAVAWLLLFAFAAFVLGLSRLRRLAY